MRRDIRTGIGHRYASICCVDDGNHSGLGREKKGTNDPEVQRLSVQSVGTLEVKFGVRIPLRSG